jgi:hypothetical protein
MSLPCTNVVLNSQEHLAKGLRQLYLGNYDPSISLAYRPFGNNKTVFRAAFGIFTVTNLGQLPEQQRKQSTGERSLLCEFTRLEWITAVPMAEPDHAQRVGAIGGGVLEQGIDHYYRDPQSAQWNLTVERELTANTALRVSYVGMNEWGAVLSGKVYMGAQHQRRSRRCACWVPRRNPLWTRRPGPFRDSAKSRQCCRDTPPALSIDWLLRPAIREGPPMVQFHWRPERFAWRMEPQYDNVAGNGSLSDTDHQSQPGPD